MKKIIIGLVIAILLLIFVPQTVFAHDGDPPAPHDLWTSWKWDPIVLVTLTLIMWMQVATQRKLKNLRLDWRNTLFIFGVITLFLALISPLDAVSTSLFSAHMIQHTLLLVVAPPLLVLGMPVNSYMVGLDANFRRSFFQWVSWLKPIWRILLQPWIAWALTTLTLWVWHAPILYESALENESLHMFEHISFVITSLLFWWVITRPRMRMGHSDPGILALFTMAMQCGLLGALITFAPTPWYTVYASTTQSWGLSPLEDQQLAGAIMWIPMGVIYTLAALIMFFGHLTWIEHRSKLREDQFTQEQNTLL